jgi:hypothetical protein
MTSLELIQALSSVVTAIGVLVAARQLTLTKRQEESQFEDSFTEQYRRIAARLPLKALLGKRLSESEVAESLRVFYEYFDLSNEQAFIAERGRLRSETWANWKAGIEQHMARPAFQQAWEELAPDLDGSFASLRVLAAIPQVAQKGS